MTPHLKTTVIDLSYRYDEQGYGLIAVSGKDAEKFLQGQLTSDIRQITPSSHGLSAYCNLKGRIRALFSLFLYHECYYLQCPRAILSNTLNTLQKYARFSKVELSDVSDEWDILGINIQAVDPSTSKEALLHYIAEHNTLKEFLCFPGKKEVLPSGQLINLKENLLVLALPDVHAKFEILSTPHLIETLRKHLNKYITNPIHLETTPDKGSFYYKGTFEDWKLLNIKSGIPEIWSETVEKFLPHSLNLPALKAVSFNKGCYCGQEIIARMEYRANLKRHMYRATLEESFKSPIPGTILKTHQMGEEDAGTVVMASQSGSKIEMLIETQDIYANAPNNLFITLDEKTIPLTIEQKFMDKPPPTPVIHS